jgi:hypothetical protein
VTILSAGRVQVLPSVGFGGMEGWRVGLGVGVEVMVGVGDEVGVKFGGVGEGVRVGSGVLVGVGGVVVIEKGVWVG